MTSAARPLACRELRVHVTTGPAVERPCAKSWFCRPCDRTPSATRTSRPNSSRMRVTTRASFACSAGASPAAAAPSTASGLSGAAASLVEVETFEVLDVLESPELAESNATRPSLLAAVTASFFAPARSASAPSTAAACTPSSATPSSLGARALSSGVGSSAPASRLAKTELVAASSDPLEATGLAQGSAGAGVEPARAERFTWLLGRDGEHHG